jgi:putative ATPase
MADGDGRAALTLAEEIWRAAGEGEIFDQAGLSEVVQRRAPIYDKGQEGHYNLISALHKTVRGSDPDAALYYLARMFDAGEDPLVHRAARGAHGGGGCRPRRSAGAGRRQCGEGGL